MQAVQGGVHAATPCSRRRAGTGEVAWGVVWCGVVWCGVGQGVVPVSAVCAIRNEAALRFGPGGACSGVQWRAVLQPHQHSPALASSLLRSAAASPWPLHRTSARPQFKMNTTGFAERAAGQAGGGHRGGRQPSGQRGAARSCLLWGLAAAPAAQTQPRTQLGAPHSSRLLVSGNPCRHGCTGPRPCTHRLLPSLPAAQPPGRPPGAGKPTPSTATWHLGIDGRDVRPGEPIRAQSLPQPTAGSPGGRGFFPASSTTLARKLRAVHLEVQPVTALEVVLVRELAEVR
jgi:hypothetical protein